MSERPLWQTPEQEYRTREWVAQNPRRTWEDGIESVLHYTVRVAAMSGLLARHPRKPHEFVDGSLTIGRTFQCGADQCTCCARMLAEAVAADAQRIPGEDG